MSMEENIIIKKSFFRSDLNGLRALSLFFVLIHHINKNLIPNSYLGVDIFFVISGYVLASSNSFSVERNGFLYFQNFFAKRLQRLLPSLLIYLIIFSFLICFFDGQPSNSLKTGLASIFGLSNIFLYISSSNYFSDSINLNPFTHTWSLSLEIQFYIFFLLATLITNSNKINRLSRGFILLIKIFSTISLLAYFNVDSYDPLASFYLSPLRFWEFGFGILTYELCRESYFNQKFKDYPLSEIFFLILLISILFLDNYYFGAWLNLITVFSSCSIILFIKKNSLITKLFNSEIFQWYGFRSYSFYLISWGLITIFRWTVGIKWFTLIIYFILLFIIVEIFYKYIENTFRRKRDNLKNIKKIIASFISIFLASIYIFGLKKYAGNIFLGEKLEDIETCENNINSKIWIVGDSHATVFSKLIRSTKKLKNCKLIKDKDLVGDGFLYDLSVKSRAGISSRKNLINHIGRDPDKFIKESIIKKPNFLIISNYWLANFLPSSMAFDSYGWVVKSHFNEEGDAISHEKSLDNYIKKIDLIAKLLENTTKLIIILPTPEFKEAELKYVRKQECSPQWFNFYKGAPVLKKTCDFFYKNPARISLKDLNNRRSPISEKLFDLKNNPNIFFYDPVPVICDKKDCLTISKEGKPLFDDYNHFSNYAIEEILKSDFEKFIEKLSNETI